ncbi:MAG: bifunctional adenosylcobinamide kinase/adenosylcobinamide-phosphate guanylyltransferase [Deltaproteobacteria bacterium]|nr:bifunctional adenosylcobinamide kinase/adenosylcobinamide-phosphate guanylyltransferase [Deltaproteobacteria bacterium]
MDKKFIFITGGAKSGKSSFALGLGQGFAGRKIYLATAEALDGEMEEKIRRHRQERGNGWTTIEEPRSIEERLRGLEKDGAGVVLIDCLTLWVTNLLAEGLNDGEIERRGATLASACFSSTLSIIAVSNEVGLGIVPATPLARRFRELSGVINQRMAASASEAYFVAAGMPLKLKAASQKLGIFSEVKEGRK